MPFAGLRRYAPLSAPQLEALNREHPIFRGLTGLWIPAIGPVNLVGSTRLLLPSAYASSPGAMGGRFGGQLSTESALINGTSWSFAAAFTTGIIKAQSSVIGCGPTGNPNSGFGFHGTHSNSSYAGAIYSGGSFNIIGKPTGGALVDGVRYVIGARAAGGAGAVFNNGRLTASATGLSTPNTGGRLALATNSGLGDDWTLPPAWEYYAQWGLAVHDAVFAELALRGASIFLSPLLVMLGGFTASSSFSVTFLDSAGGAEVIAMTPVRNGALTDAGGGADLYSATAARNAALLDAAAGADLYSASAARNATAIDQAAGTDIISAGSALAATLLDAAQGDDIRSAVSTLLASLTDGATVDDVRTASMVANATAIDAAAGADLLNAGNTANRSLVDGAAGAEALQAAAVMVASLVDAASLADQFNAAQQLVVLLTDAAAGSDLRSGSVPVTYNVSLVDLVAALDVLSGAVGGITLAAGRRRVAMPDVQLLQRQVRMPAHAQLARSVAMYPA